MRCEEIMKHDVVCVSQDDAVLKAADKMRKENVGFLPVCDRSGVVIGTITDRDITIRVVAEGLSPSTTLVRSVMTNEVIACRPNDDVHFAEELMGQKHKSRILCTDDKGRIQGVISLSDIALWDSERALQTMQQVASREATLS